MSLLCGFLTVFTGVYLLNFNGSNLESPSTPSEYELASGLGSPSRERISLQGSVRSVRSGPYHSANLNLSENMYRSTID